MATLQDYLGITALRDAWPKWKANVIAINNQVINHVAGSADKHLTSDITNDSEEAGTTTADAINTNKAKVADHVAGTADKHSAQDITYTGDFVGKTEVKAAIDQAKSEIDTIVVNASIDPEVAFARDSAVKSKVFGSLDARLEEDEQDLVKYKAETAHINEWFRSMDNSKKYIAHRGSRMIAPENTIPSYELAGNLGYWGFEADILITSDNEFILMHDNTVDRMTDGSGYVSALTLSQIKALNIDNGYNIASYPNTKVPTLREFLTVCLKYNAIPMLQIKSDFTLGQCQSFVDILDEFGVRERCIVVAYHEFENAFNNLHSIDEKIVLAVWVTDVIQTEIDRVKSYSNSFLYVDQTLLTTENIAIVKQQGLKIGAWTVSQKTYYNYPLQSVDLLVSDDLLKGVL